MSTDGNLPKIEIQCPVCSQRFSCDMPPGEFFNNVRSSGIVATHDKFTRCINAKCRTAFVLVVTGAQLNWNAQAVPPEVAAEVEGSRIIPPLSVLPPH